MAQIALVVAVIAALVTCPAHCLGLVEPEVPTKHCRCCHPAPAPLPPPANHSDDCRCAACICHGAISSEPLQLDALHSELCLDGAAILTDAFLALGAVPVSTGPRAERFVPSGRCMRILHCTFLL